METVALWLMHDSLYSAGIMWRPKKVSLHSSIVQIIFCFWSFEIMEYILRARNRSYVKIHFLNKFEIFWYFSIYISL